MEKWRTIEGFEEYKVSNFGRICRAAKGRGTNAVNGILKPGIHKKGYLLVYLSKHSKKYTKKVHILVAKAFLPNPKNLPQVNHKNGIKSNCSVSNLEWRTQLGNMRHSVQLGLHGRDVTKRKDNGKWRARYAPAPYKRITIGQFDTKEEAENALQIVLKTLPYIP